MLGLILLIVLFISAACSHMSKDEKLEDPGKQKSGSRADSVIKAVSADVSQTAAGAPDDFSALEDRLNDMLENEPGDWSVYIKNLDTGQVFLPPYGKRIPVRK